MLESLFHKAANLFQRASANGCFYHFRKYSYSEPCQVSKVELSGEIDDVLVVWKASQYTFDVVTTKIRRKSTSKKKGYK